VSFLARVKRVAPPLALACTSVGMSFGLSACNTVPTGELVADLDTDQTLSSFYQQRGKTTVDTFKNAALLGNIAEWHSSDQIHVADQTVYLGFFVAWQSLAALDDPTDGALTQLGQALDHLSTKLVVPTQVNGQANTGYFVRDDMSANPVTIDGTTYQASSDDLNGGTSDQQSQDQVIHLLFGYSLAARALPLSKSPLAAPQLAKIVRHANDIGLRLKSMNYVIHDPQGQEVARGADARAMSWAIAQTIANITGQPITTYLDGVDVQLRTKNETLHFTNADLQNLFVRTLQLIDLGVCDLQYGDEHEDVCNRFFVALVNAMFVGSRSYALVPTYFDRIDKDGDYIYGAAGRALRGDRRMPKAYLDAATSADGVAFDNATGPALWCKDNRWVRMPVACPDGTTPTYDYNALDFLSYYQVLKHLVRLGPPPAP
jgi:hypothetical protein